ncbi:MAG: hypothetical protein LBR26_02115, partial [Prevotella sp.]|nr:hypothetical protein [Prevotella sp.]
ESVPVVNNTVDLSGNTGDSDNELRFYTEGDSNGTGALTATLDLTLGTDYGASNVTPVPDGDPVVTYSIGKVRQYYKITLPKTTYPVEGTLTIKDGETQLEQVLDITSVPKYENTDYTPVLVRGKYSGPDKDDEDRYWAPVNVGATSTSYSTTEAGRGHYFQWGRNVPFTTYNSSNDTYPNPVTVETPPENYANKFIISATAPNDWLDPKDDTLWQGANAQGPCPAGWRVPTETEFTVLGSKSTGNLSSNTRLTFSGVNSTYLYLPAAGFRDNTGGWSNTASWGRYWSSTFTEDKAKSFYFLSNQINIGVDPRAMGLSVRCIQKEAVKNEE